MTKRKSFDEIRARVDADPYRRARVEMYKHGALAALALAELRESRQLRQVDVAKSLGVTQANVSRLEREEDVYVSTLRNYVSALGGTLELNAVFPEEEIKLVGLRVGARLHVAAPKQRGIGRAQKLSAKMAKGATSGAGSKRSARKKPDKQVAIIDKNPSRAKKRK